MGGVQVTQIPGPAQADLGGRGARRVPQPRQRCGPLCRPCCLCAQDPPSKGSAPRKPRARAEPQLAGPSDPALSVRNSGRGADGSQPWDGGSSGVSGLGKGRGLPGTSPWGEQEVPGVERGDGRERSDRLWAEHSHMAAMADGSSSVYFTPVQGRNWGWLSHRLGPPIPSWSLWVPVPARLPIQLPGRSGGWVPATHARRPNQSS